MTAVPNGENRGLVARWGRLSLRARGIVVMAVPLAAMVGALFTVYSLEVDVQRADQALFAQIQAHVQPLTQEDVDAIARVRAQRDELRHRLFRWVAICGYVGPLAALLLHVLVTRRLAGRLRAVAENARRLAHGLPLNPFPPGKDEVASLAQQIEEAANLLRARNQDLGQSEQRYRELFASAPVAFEEANSEGAITRFNQAVCSLLRCGPDRLLGSRVWDFVAPDQQESFREAFLERAAAGTELAPFECDFLLEDGSLIVVEVRESFTRDGDGKVTGVIRSLLDVTERNLAAVAARKVSQYAMELRNKNELLGRALEQARSATEAKTRFLAAVSHELRTPLNGIIGFTELLHDGRLGAVSEEHKEVLGDILMSSQHLLQLINDILDLTKVEAGKMDFRPEPSRIADLVGEVRDVVRPLAEKKAIDLTAEVPEELTAVIDQARFKQVLYNYLSNAVKFTPRQGRVAVRVMRTDDSFFTLEVEDTGVGIPANQMPGLFQEFQQLSNSRKAQQGTGLGLAVTKHLVEAQGGKVAVRSEEGRGSVFSAVLPLIPNSTSAETHGQFGR